MQLLQFKAQHYKLIKVRSSYLCAEKKCGIEDCRNGSPAV